MNKKFLYTLSFLIGISLFGFAHKYFTSICDLNYNEKTKSFECILTTDVDNVEICLSKFLGKKITYDSKEFKETLIRKLRADLIIKSKKGESYAFEFINLELKKDHLIVYLEFIKIKDYPSVQIKNNFLLAEFPKQVNLVNIQSPQGKKTLVFKN